VVGYGADPVHCLGVVVSDAERRIAGNHDLGAVGRVPLEVFAPWAAAALLWTTHALGPVGRAKLERLEPLDEDGAVPLFHGSPRDPVWEYVVTADQARAALEDRRVPLTFIGHTHVPSAWRLTPDGALESAGVPARGLLRLTEGRWLVNPGSVGQPRDRDARAAWALYDPDAGTVAFRRTPYDVAGAQAAILEAGLPSPPAHRLAEGR
jgi:diadenosine tetraphosphatase ApaH/serine/threonine PP2A family protein phosphatase